MAKWANDRTGQRFGYRVVLERVASQVRPKWLVQCDCGHVFTCLTQDLNRKSKCRFCGHRGPRPYRRKRPYEARYNSLIQRRKHPVHITYEQFAALTLERCCHYCGIGIRWQPYRQKGSGTGCNLDRKDSSLPYTLDNVVVCCWRCNKAKNTHFTYDEWIEIGRVIRSWYGALECNIKAS